MTTFDFIDEIDLDGVSMRDFTSFFLWTTVFERSSFTVMCLVTTVLAYVLSFEVVFFTLLTTCFVSLVATLRCLSLPILVLSSEDFVFDGDDYGHVTGLLPIV